MSNYRQKFDDVLVDSYAMMIRDVWIPMACVMSQKVGTPDFPGCMIFYRHVPSCSLPEWAKNIQKRGIPGIPQVMWMLLFLGKNKMIKQPKGNPKQMQIRHLVLRS